VDIYSLEPLENLHLELVFLELALLQGGGPGTISDSKHHSLAGEAAVVF
jgi:hypothetical protein